MQPGLGVGGIKVEAAFRSHGRAPATPPSLLNVVSSSEASTLVDSTA